MKRLRLIAFTKFVLISLGLLMFMSLYKVLPYRLAFNLTNSEARGIYLLEFSNSLNYKLGNLVIVCVPDLELARMSVKRGYLASGERCPYKTAYEIKHIKAIAHQTVTIVNDSVVIDQIKVKILSYDSFGRELKSKLISQEIPQAHYFVMGQTANSFDSRYYGLVPSSFILGFAYLIFSWE